MLSVQTINTKWMSTTDKYTMRHEVQKTNLHVCALSVGHNNFEVLFQYQKLERAELDSKLTRARYINTLMKTLYLIFVRKFYM